MRISSINTYQYSFKGLFNKPQKPANDFIIRGQGEKVLKYEFKNDILFVKGKPYTGIVRLDYTNGRKEHRNYEEGKLRSSDINGDGNAKVFYSYKIENGQVKKQVIYEGDDGLEGIKQ